ncbi:uncharacterized protein [Hyperolius riggenbachi]|uniref:uncharacterized protein isoform X2 n=1 Tax=Hyperolius riggenbachi TaxID=752182 RepID=UPI0035A3A851
MFSWGRAQGDGVPNNLSGFLGSTIDLPCPGPCSHDAEMTCELRSGKHQQPIGWYEGGHLKARLHFKGRLKFDQKNCSFLLKKVSLEDSGMYSVITHYSEDDRPKNYESAFNITVLDHTTPIPPAVQTVTSQHGNQTACSLGFPAFCLSVVPATNVLLSLIYCIPCWPGGHIQDAIKISLQISGYFSLAFQVISIACWTISCEIRNTVVWFTVAISSTIILLLCAIKCPSSHRKCPRLHPAWLKNVCKCKETALQQWGGCILQLGFTACTLAAFYPTHGDLMLENIWVPITFAVTFLLPNGIFCIIYYFSCKPKNPEPSDINQMKTLNPSASRQSQKRAKRSVQPAH